MNHTRAMTLLAAGVFVVGVGLVVAGEPSDRRRPYGHLEGGVLGRFVGTTKCCCSAARMLNRVTHLHFAQQLYQRGHGALASETIALVPYLSDLPSISNQHFVIRFELDEDFQESTHRVD